MPYTISPSRFTAGSLASATGLNLLRQSILALLGAYRRPRPVWAARRHDSANWEEHDLGSGGWHRIYDGWIRHKANTLAWTVQVQREQALSCEIRLNYGAQSALVSTLAAGSNALTTPAGTINVSAQAGFYPVSIDVRALSGTTPVGGVTSLSVLPLQLAETAPINYSPLHRFFTGDVPSAADWQALSERAQTLADQLGGGCAPWLGGSPLPNENLWGTIAHTNEYLRYDLRLSRPEIYPPNRTDPEHGTYIAVIFYNDVQVGAAGWGVLASANTTMTSISLKNAAYFSNGQLIDLQSGHRVQLGGKSGGTFSACTLIWDGWRKATAGDWLRHSEPTDLVGDKENDYANFTGVFDLRSLPLTEGATYTVRVLALYDSHGWGSNTTAKCKINLLAEQPATTPTLTGWSAMSVFTAGASIAGASGVKALRDNLAWLSSRVTYDNPAAPRRWWWQPSFWTLRHERWLHYYCRYDSAVDQSQPQPNLGYFRGGEWKTGGLPYRPNEWLVYDLDSLDGLWPGQPYRVALPGWCLEDETP